jgi:signal transduction histidine kinase
MAAPPALTDRAIDADRPPVVPRAVVDLVLVLVVGAIEIGVTAVAAGHQDRGDLGIAGISLLALSVAALPLRHRHPVGVLWWVLGTTLAYVSLGYPRGPVFFGLIIAFAQVVLTGHRRAAVMSLVVGYAGFLWLGAWLGRDDAPNWGEIAALAAWLVTLLCVIELVRSRRDRAREAARRRADDARRRVADERLRIARDLHDAVAHNMSMINIQAGVALHLMDREPGRARDALATIKAASKEALVELRSIVGVLRQVDEEVPRAPTPSLARLDDLVSSAAAAGVDVRVDVDGDLALVPRQADLAAFRILQESLTNVARHSDAAEATVRIRTADGVLGLEVLDEGTGGRQAVLPGGGNGIPGMRERAVSVGGTLDAGPRPGRGFAVRARLPLDPT